MGELFDVGHVAQLHEIQKARLRAGLPGIGREIEELIRRLTSGGVAGKAVDERVRQARRYWVKDLRASRVLSSLHHNKFEEYFATIPQVPAELVGYDNDFPFLVLVEPRIGLKRLCKLGHIEFKGDDSTFDAYDACFTEYTEPTWIRMQDGRKNHGISAESCRISSAGIEFSLTALQGVCAYLQHPDVVSEVGGSSAHIMDLPGSVARQDRAIMAHLGVWNGQAKLIWHYGGCGDPIRGSASRRAT